MKDPKKIVDQGPILSLPINIVNILVLSILLIQIKCLQENTRLIIGNAQFEQGRIRVIFALKLKLDDRFVRHSLARSVLLSVFCQKGST